MSSAAFSPGSTLVGKYRVERELGAGGMGVVLEATHTALEQRVAIKVLNERFAASPEMTARFVREARVAARLQSDHIARVTDVGQLESGAPYIVMELLVGHDLETELRERRTRPVSDAVDLILQATQGVADAHAIGLVHRDLKPANLFLARRPGRAPIVKVLDFGLSKEAPGGAGKSLTGDDSVFGTPQYMSPEQVQSSKNVDARSDQHALAMILFELLTGESPYNAETVTALVVMIATRPPPSARALRPDVPRDLDQAIGRALAKRPSERFADVADFADAIARFGGASARDLAKSIRASLASRGSIEPSVLRAAAPDDASLSSMDTAPLGVPAARVTPAPSQTGLTSSVDFIKKSRRSKRIAVIGGASLALALAVVVVIVAAGGSDRSASTSGDVSPASLPSASPSALNVAPAAPAASSSSKVLVTPASPSSSSQSPPQSAAKKPPPSTTKPPKSMPRPSVSSVIGVFGERTK